MQSDGRRCGFHLFHLFTPEMTSLTDLSPLLTRQFSFLTLNFDLAGMDGSVNWWMFVHRDCTRGMEMGMEMEMMD